MQLRLRRHLLDAAPVVGAAQPLAAVDHEGFADDVRGVVAEKVGGGVRDFVDRRETAQRDREAAWGVLRFRGLEGLPKPPARACVYVRSDICYQS